MANSFNGVARIAVKMLTTRKQLESRLYPIKSEVFYTVNNDERLRLFDQRVHMRRYASVLLDRIDAFLAAT